jgi:hypothetical protein
MNEMPVGTCSICGGTVVVPVFWISIIPPVPTCKDCGAIKASGPIIPMTPRKAIRTITSDNTSELGIDIVKNDPVKITSTS